MNWTKTTTAQGTHYRHRNGLTLREGAGRMWTTQNDAGQGFHQPSTSAMRCLARGLEAADLRTKANGTYPEGHPAHMPVWLSVDQLVEAIADLHAGGLP